MKKLIAAFACLIIVAFSLTACGWRPNVTAVPLMAPWDTMNLPVKENAVVWVSSDDELKVAHKEDKKTVLGKYVDALKKQGWALADFNDKSAGNYFIDLTKGADKIEIEIYDFQNTGVIIKKK